MQTLSLPRGKLSMKCAWLRVQPRLVKTGIRQEYNNYSKYVEENIQIKFVLKCNTKKLKIQKIAIFFRPFVYSDLVLGMFLSQNKLRWKLPIKFYNLFSLFF